MKKLVSFALVMMMLMAMAVPAMAEEEVTLKWMHHFQEEPLQKWVEGRAAAFEESHPGVKVEIEMVSNDSYLNTLKMKMAADDAPDMFDLDNNTYLREFVDADYIYCVDGQNVFGEVDEGLLGDCQIDGVRYGSTISTAAYSIWYNKEVFEKVGVEVPTTYEEFIDVCEKIQAAGITPMATAFAERSIGFNMWFHPFYTNYCWKDDFNWAVDKASGKSTFAEDDRPKKAWEEFMSTSKYWSDDPFGTSYDDACMAIANGEAAMISNGTWILAKLLEYNPDIQLGVFGYPTKEFGGNLVMRPGSIMCIYNNTKDEKKLELTKELFASLFTAESGEAFASGAMQLSSVKGVNYDFSPVLGEIIDYPNNWSIAGFQRWGNEYEDVFFDVAMALALDGNADPEAFCAELDAQFSTIQ